MFLYKKFFFQYLFFQAQSCVLESTAAIFRQSAGYVDYFQEPRNDFERTVAELSFKCLRADAVFCVVL